MSSSLDFGAGGATEQRPDLRWNAVSTLKTTCIYFRRIIVEIYLKYVTRVYSLSEMDTGPGIDGFRISNPPGLLCACVRASLDVCTVAPYTKIQTYVM